MKKTLFASLISATSLFACTGPVFAGDYYVVVPMPGKAAQLTAINVVLNSYTLPEAVVGSPYAGFDFKTVLSVTGDSAYNGTGVTWSVATGTLPAGMTLNGYGILSGTPSAAGTSNFSVKATYQTKAGQQTYQVVSLNITVDLVNAILPAAKVNTAYTPYDFKPLLAVTGDPAYSANNVNFSATGVPDGMSVSSTGVLSGTPTTQSSGANFQVVASYKTKTGQQAYTIVVNGATLQVTQIAAGTYHTCAVTTSGGAKCWGYNANGQLGTNSTADSLVPADVSGLGSGVSSISAGGGHSCAVTTTGGAKCWGNNGSGQLGINSSTNSSVPVQVSGLASGVASISVGNNSTCAVTTTGGAKCWGNNGKGQLGNNSVTNSLVPVDVSGLTYGVGSIEMGDYHTCAVTTSSGAKCWGYNLYGQLGTNGTADSLVPADVSGLASGVSSISAGGYYTCAVTTSGGAKCWGYNANGRLGNNSTTNSAVPVDVFGMTSGVSSISAGGGQTCAVTTTGGAKCWGYNANGRLGNNSTTNSTVPVAVVGMTSGVSSINAGGAHTCAVTTTAGAKCWGYGFYGELGNNSTTQSLIPADVSP